MKILKILINLFKDINIKNNNMDNLIIDLFKKKLIIIENNTIICKFNNLISFPYLINTIVKFIYEKLKLLEKTNILGICTCKYKCNCMQHISSIISYNHNIPLLMLNKNKLIDGVYEDNNCIVLFNDIFDNGGNILKYISILEANKLNISCIFNIYDDNSIKIIDTQKYKIISLCDANYILKLLISKNIINHDYFNYSNQLTSKIKRIMKLKKSKICYDCNITNIKDLVRDVDNIGSKIILLKICSNNIDNFNTTYGNALHKLANNHNFIIVDNIGLYNFSHINIDNYDWCDILTTYNINIKCNKDLIYINSNSLDIINNNFVGIIGRNITNGQYLHVSNTINSVDELKIINLSHYDLITINNNICNEKIINYINKN
jgi:hypothetical protein